MRYEKGQSGCMWSLINMFDFRHGRSTRRLLSDRKRDNWQAVGKKLVYYSNKLYMILSNSSAQGKKME